MPFSASGAELATLPDSLAQPFPAPMPVPKAEGYDVYTDNVG